MTLLAQFAATGGTGVANYIEDVFSTWLFTGNGSTQAIVNGIDLAGKGGFVWTKKRNTGSNNHLLYDTVRGGNKSLVSNNTDAQNTETSNVLTFNSNGFTTGTGFNSDTAANLVAWTFREQAKFFDVLTYAGDGTGYRSFATTLGSAAGCIIIKDTSNAGAWYVYHRSLGDNNYLLLNTTDAASGVGFVRNVTASSFETSLNTSGRTYVAYLFAHNAGGFGLTGNDNVISCGSYTGNGSTTGPLINLGWEPQWLLVKQSSISGAGWYLIDTMRGATSSGTDAVLFANLSQSETSDSRIAINATGFQPIQAGGELNASGETCIYIAIRRGPMKVPTTGTSVYYAQATQDVNTSFQTGFPVDMVIDRYGFWNDSQVPQTGSFYVYDRLRGSPRNLVTNTTAAETSSQPSFFVATTGFQSNTRLGVGPGDGSLGNNYAFFWNFRRAPGFFDEVITPSTYTTGIVNHNLTVVPELMIEKTRSTSTTNWRVYHKDIPAGGALNLADAFDKTLSPKNPTSTTFEYGNDNAVVYLFASAPGVSKVGSYTGTATTQVINCGFTGGARFVMIKRTDSTGDWYVWDSARGIVAGNDPYLLLNSTAAEVTSTDYVDTAASGFELTATAPAAINASGGTYIFLAIA